MVMTPASLSATNWLTTLTALVTSLASSSTSYMTGWPSIPSGCRALNAFRVMLLNDWAVAWPKAAWAPVSGVEIPNLIGPGGMGGYCDAAAAVVADPPAVVADVAVFLAELLHAAVRAVPAAMAASTVKRFRMNLPLGCGAPAVVSGACQNARTSRSSQHASRQRDYRSRGRPPARNTVPEGVVSRPGSTVG